MDCNKVLDLVCMFDTCCDLFSSNNMLACFGYTITYAEFNIYLHTVTKYLIQNGVEIGTRVGVMLPNIIPIVVIIASILKAGGIVVLINPLYKINEIENLIKNSGAEFLFVAETSLDIVKNLKAPVKQLICVSIGCLTGFRSIFIDFYLRYIMKIVKCGYDKNLIYFNNIIDSDIKEMIEFPRISPNNIAFIQFTGGTTGEPKGVVLKHKHIISNIFQVEEKSSAAYKGFNINNFISILALPLYHAFGLHFAAMHTFFYGGLGVLIPDPRKSNDLVAAFKKYKPNIMAGVNTLFKHLIDNPEFEKLNFDDYYVSLSGGMALDPNVKDRLERITKAGVLVGYGLSEASPIISISEFDFNKEKKKIIVRHEADNCVGKPLSNTKIKILTLANEENNNATDELTGQICVAGPQIFENYWNMDDNKNFFDNEGYFLTGDVGYIKNDNLFLSGRSKNIINISGFNVYPLEIETIVKKLKGVSECAVIGCKEENSVTEYVKLFIVSEKDANLTKDDVIKYCKEMLASYKRPKYVEFIDSLPKSSIGKVLAHKLS